MSDEDGSFIRKWVETRETDGDGKDGGEDGWHPSDCCPASGPGIQCPSSWICVYSKCFCFQCDPLPFGGF